MGEHVSSNQRRNKLWLRVSFSWTKCGQVLSHVSGTVACRSVYLCLTRTTTCRHWFGEWNFTHSCMSFFHSHWLVLFDCLWQGQFFGCMIHLMRYLHILALLLLKSVMCEFWKFWHKCSHNEWAVQTNKIHNKAMQCNVSQVKKWNWWESICIEAVFFQHLHGKRGKTKANLCNVFWLSKHHHWQTDTGTQKHFSFPTQEIRCKKLAAWVNSSTFGFGHRIWVHCSLLGFRCAWKQRKFALGAKWGCWPLDFVTLHHWAKCQCHKLWEKENCHGKSIFRKSLAVFFALRAWKCQKTDALEVLKKSVVDKQMWKQTRRFCLFKSGRMWFSLTDKNS